MVFVNKNMQNNNFKKIFSIILISSVLFTFSSVIVQAQSAGSVIQQGIGDTANVAQLSGSSRDLSTFIGSVVKNLLGFLGTIFFVLILYAGFMWMTAAGNDERITKAKKILSNSVIGLAVVVFAYAIVGFVLNAFIQADDPPAPATTMIDKNMDTKIL